jgi:hypothetical protein
MGANQNSSMELGLCLELTQHASLLTRLRPRNYRQAIGPWNRDRNLNSHRKVMSETPTTKIR